MSISQADLAAPPNRRAVVAAAAFVLLLGRADEHFIDCHVASAGRYVEHGVGDVGCV